MTMETATNVTDEVFFYVKQLFLQLWNQTIPIRLLGVQAGKITDDSNYQYSLFETDKHEKLSKLDTALDQIRNKFGNQSITRACFLEEERNP